MDIASKNISVFRIMLTYLLCWLSNKVLTVHWILVSKYLPMQILKMQEWSEPLDNWNNVLMGDTSGLYMIHMWLAYTINGLIQEYTSFLSVSTCFLKVVLWCLPFYVKRQIKHDLGWNILGEFKLQFIWVSKGLLRWNEKSLFLFVKL